MFSILSTYLLYNSILIICPLLCYIAELKDRVSLRYLAYFILMFVSAIRFDIGADYETYYAIFEEIVDTFKYWQFSWTNLLYEPATYLITFLFIWTPTPSIWVVAAYTVLTFIILYKVFDRDNIHTLGIATLCITFTYFEMWDWVRQALAFSVCLYSLRYVKDGIFWKFLLCIIIATLTHYSALLFLLVYPLRKINIATQWLGVGVFIIFLAGRIGLFSGTQNFFFDIIPYYSDIYSGTEYVQRGGHTYTTTAYALTMLCFGLMLIITPREFSLEAFIIFVGVIIFGISGGNLNMDRIAWYFTNVQIVLLPLLHKSMLIPRKKVLLFGIFILYFILLNFVYIRADFRGCTPYETIFSEEYKELYFRERRD